MIQTSNRRGQAWRIVALETQKRRQNDNWDEGGKYLYIYVQKL